MGMGFFVQEFLHCFCPAVPAATAHRQNKPKAKKIPVGKFTDFSFHNWNYENAESTWSRVAEEKEG